VKYDEGTAVFYEAPHRILEALVDIETELGPARPVVVARELTKLHEEFNPAQREKCEPRWRRNL